MTRTDRRGSPVLDGVKIAVAPARGAVSSPTRSAHHGGLAQTPPPPPPPDEFRRPAIVGRLPNGLRSTCWKSGGVPTAADQKPRNTFVQYL